MSFSARISSSLETSSSVRRPAISRRQRLVVLASAQSENAPSPSPQYLSRPEGSIIEFKAAVTENKVEEKTWTKRIDMTKPEWWKQVDDWDAFFRSEQYLLDDGNIEDYMLPEDIESGRVDNIATSNQILPAYLKERDMNPAARMARGELDPDLADRVAQEEADRDLEADFEAEEVAEMDDEVAPTPKPKRGRSQPVSEETEYRHVVLKALAELERRTDVDSSFISLMDPALRKRLMLEDYTDSEAINAWPKDPELSEWDLRAKVEKRRRLEKERAEFDRRRALIGQFPVRPVTKSDVRLKNGPNYDEMFGKQWTDEEIWNLITMDGKAADIRKIGDRVLTVMDPEVRYDYPGNFGYEYVLETEEFLMKSGHWMRPGAISTDAELTLLSSDFKDLDALNALGVRGAGAGKKGGAQGGMDGLSMMDAGDGNEDDF